MNPNFRITIFDRDGFICCGLKILKKHFFTVSIVLGSPALWGAGQGSLPQCTSDVSSYWHNCVGKYETELSLYIGQWVDNKKSGVGTYVYDNGRTYVGEFLNDKFNGEGALFNRDGLLLFSGTWRDDALVNNHPVSYSFPKNIKRLTLKRDSSSSVVAISDPLSAAKRECKSLGFKEKTEKFGTCVLELSKRESTQAPPPVPPSPVPKGDGSADDQTCAGYGYRVGTASYSDCRLQLDMARRDYEREIRAYEAEKAAYEKKVAEAQAEQKRRQQQRQAQYGFCVAQCSAQPGSTALGCMSRCGAASAGLSYDPGAPPTRPSGRTTYVINGQIINCRTSPSGSVVTCN
jgi:hypothetical protein